MPNQNKKQALQTKTHSKKVEKHEKDGIKLNTLPTNSSNYFLTFLFFFEPAGIFQIIIGNSFNLTCKI